jgi:hypothetical protein
VEEKYFWFQTPSPKVLNIQVLRVSVYVETPDACPKKL